MKAPPRSRGHQTLHLEGSYFPDILPMIQSIGIYSDTPLKYEIYSDSRRFGSFLTSPIDSRLPKKEFELSFEHGNFWVDIENGTDEEVEFWYQIQGCWVVNEQELRNRYGYSEERLREQAKEVINRYKTRGGGFPQVNFKTNKIETEEERSAREERNRIEREKQKEERDRAKQECTDLLTQLEVVMNYDEVDEIEKQMTQKLEEHNLSFIHVSPHVDQAKRRIKNHLKQQAQEQAWSELATEIGVENANGVKNGNYYVFQGENNEWFAIGGPQNYLYNLDREQKYCLTVQSETRIPEPDQILTKILWAKNNVEYVFDKGNVIGGLTDKLQETKIELRASKRLSIKDLIKNIGKR